MRLPRPVVVNVALILGVLMAVGAFYKSVLAESKAAAKLGVEKAEAASASLESHVAKSEREHDAIRQDVRDLYQYLLTKRRQKRLEAEESP